MSPQDWNYPESAFLSIPKSTRFFRNSCPSSRKNFTKIDLQNLNKSATWQNGTRKTARMKTLAIFCTEDEYFTFYNENTTTLWQLMPTKVIYLPKFSPSHQWVVGVSVSLLCSANLLGALNTFIVLYQALSPALFNILKVCITWAKLTYLGCSGWHICRAIVQKHVHKRWLRQADCSTCCSSYSLLNMDARTHAKGGSAPW